MLSANAESMAFREMLFRIRTSWSRGNAVISNPLPDSFRVSTDLAPDLICTFGLSDILIDQPFSRKPQRFTL